MASDATRYGDSVQRYGLSKTHRQTIEWVSEGAHVLEVGCSTGYLGHALIEQKNCRVTGIEVDPAAAAVARANGIDVIEGSVEAKVFRESITGSYDFILANDVLEHLRDPAAVLEHFHEWLSPGGRVIVSVPNIANWEIRRNLFFGGDFDYQETGILDRTHLRFFTWNTFHDLLTLQGWSVLDEMIDCWHLPVIRRLLVGVPSKMERLAAGRGAATDLPRRLVRQWINWGLGVEESITWLAPNLWASQFAVLIAPKP